MRSLIVLAMFAGCSPKPPGTDVAPPVPSPGPASGDFCDTLGTLIAAADGDFVSLRAGEPSTLMPSWASKATLPGASSCRVADADPVSFGSVFCVLVESTDNAALERDFEATANRVSGCLQGWKSDTGEQLGTRWLELEPLPQKSATRSLQVHVRLTEAKDTTRGSVTVDVAVKRPQSKS